MKIYESAIYPEIKKPFEIEDGFNTLGYIAETKGPLFYCGVAGGVKLGFTLNKLPLKFAVDWTPAFGPVMYHNQLVSEIAFNAMALADFGVSCVYYF